MLYLVIIFLVLYCTYRFDIHNQNKYKNSWFYFLMILFIVVAGFAYRLGYDNAHYMREFPSYSVGNGYDWHELTSYKGRQPMWVLMTKISKSIVNNYWFFRLLHSILLNTLMFLALRKLTKYIFTTILFYFVLVYFEFNFQVMRQSLAVALFMFSITKYENNKWLSYYFINILGFLFHESAIITFFLPLIKLLRISRGAIVLFFVASVTGAVVGPLLVEALLPNVLDSFIGDKALFYMSKMEDNGAIIGFNIILNVLIPFVFISIKSKHNNLSSLDYFVIVYGTLYGLGLSVPIIYRFNQFFLMCFYVCYIEIFAHLSIWIKSKFGMNARIIFMCICIMFLTYRARMYFMPFGGINHIPKYVQFYPYHSILFEKKDPVREDLLTY